MNIYLLQHLLRESAKNDPEKAAVVFMNKSLSYGNLEKKSNQLASALSRLGVKKGDRVGLLLTKSLDSIIGLFGILKVGASYVPIDPLSPSSRWRYIINDCGIECLLTSKNRMTKVLDNLDSDSPLKIAIISDEPTEQLTKKSKNLELLSWEKITKLETEDPKDFDITDGYPAYILYTSGSTGSPKGVVISHLNSLTFVNMAADFFEINKEDRLSGHAPLHFDLSVFDIFVAVKKGATIVLIPEHLSIFPIKLAEYIHEQRISVWNSVPSVLTLLAERGKLERFQFDSLRLVLFSGEIFPVKYLRRVKIHMPRAQFFNGYGQTEANTSTYYQINQIPKDDTWRIPIGKPFPNFELFALNENNEVISSPGEEGELFVRGSTVAIGYWRDTERTSANFVPDHLQCFSSNRVYKTGDIVRLDKDKNYIFVGRKDHLVKSRGYRIEMDEIEITLNSCPGIKQAAVVAVPDDLVGNKIIAYISPIEGTKLAVRDILSHCSRLLPKYMIPEAIEFCGQLPETSTGKTDRKLLSKEALLSFARKNQSPTTTQ